MKGIIGAFFFILSVLSPAIGARDEGGGKGQKLYQAQCLQCHGSHGQGGLPHKTPRLAGQADWYIVASLKAFQGGKERQHPQTAQLIKPLSEEEMASLAAYLMELRPL